MASSITSTATAALSLLLLCGVVLTASANMKPDGPLLVHLVTNSETTGPKCFTKNHSTGFLDAGPLGTQKRGQVPIGNSTSVEPVYQELVSKKDGRYTFQIHIVAYDGADRVYYCNRYLTDGNAFRVSTPKMTPTGQTGIRLRSGNRNRNRSRTRNRNANTNVGAAGDGSGSSGSSTATLVGPIAGGILFFMGIAMYVSWRWQGAQFDMMRQQMEALRQRQHSYQRAAASAV